MARTNFANFDAQAINVDSGASALAAGFSYDTSIKRTDRRASLKCITTSGVNNTQSLNLSPTLWSGIWVNFTAFPAATRRIFAGTSGSVSLRINPDGTVAFYNSTFAQGTSTTVLSLSTWYLIAFRGGTGTSVPVLLIDGNTEVTASPSGWTLQQNFGAADTVADTYTVYYSEYIQDDTNAPAAGTSVALLLPISDNARAALWVAGSNATTATTNLWEGVNNTPPVGTATSIPVANGISHEGGAAGSTDDYDANMTSYSSAGIAAGATVNAVRSLYVHAEDIATGAKLLTASIKSNPAQGAFESNVTAGNGSAAGTYPTNWVTARGTIISSPSVVLGTSPVMTMRRPETASRRADVCFMGIYVDYTPGAPAEPWGITHSRGTFLSFAGGSGALQF